MKSNPVELGPVGLTGVDGETGESYLSLWITK